MCPGADTVHSQHHGRWDRRGGLRPGRSAGGLRARVGGGPPCRRDALGRQVEARDAQARIVGMSPPEWARYLSPETRHRPVAGSGGRPRHGPDDRTVRRGAARYAWCSRSHTSAGAVAAVGLASSSPPRLHRRCAHRSESRCCVPLRRLDRGSRPRQAGTDVYLAAAEHLGCCGSSVRRCEGFEQRLTLRVRRRHGRRGRAPTGGIPQARRRSRKRTLSSTSSMA